MGFFKNMARVNSKNWVGSIGSGLTWKNVNFENGQIVVYPGKTGDVYLSKDTVVTASGKIKSGIIGNTNQGKKYDMYTLVLSEAAAESLKFKDNKVELKLFTAFLNQGQERDNSEMVDKIVSLLNLNR